MKKVVVVVTISLICLIAVVSSYSWYLYQTSQSFRHGLAIGEVQDLVDSRNLEKAEELIDDAIQTHGDHPILIAQKGDIYALSGDFRQAVSFYNKALEAYENGEFETVYVSDIAFIKGKKEFAEKEKLLLTFEEFSTIEREKRKAKDTANLPTSESPQATD